MFRTLLSAAVLALAAAGVVYVGAGSDLEHLALLGAAVGGALAMAPSRRPLGTLGAFVVGFLLSWAAFVLRAAALPDSATGRALAAAFVVVACGGIAAVSRSRLPMWSMLLGSAVLVGAYEQTYMNAPTQILTDSPAAASTVLLAAAVGYAASSLVEAIGAPAVRRAAQAEARATVGEEAVADAPAATRRATRALRDGSARRLAPATRAGGAAPSSIEPVGEPATSEIEPVGVETPGYARAATGPLTQELTGRYGADERRQPEPALAGRHTGGEAA